MWHFLLHFLPDLRQIWTFKFPKVVRQHNWGVVGNNIQVLLEISFSFQWTNFENRLRFDEVTIMSMVAPFLGHGVNVLCIISSTVNFLLLLLYLHLNRFCTLSRRQGRIHNWWTGAKVEAPREWGLGGGVPSPTGRGLGSFYLHTSTVGTSVTYPRVKNISHANDGGAWPPAPGSALARRNY